MDNSLTIKQTSLSTSTDVVSTLKWKMDSLVEAEKDPQIGISDYIGRAVTEIESRLAYLKEMKSEAAALEKQLKEQKEAILEGTADFMEGFGAEKLAGVMVSSITITKAKAASTKPVFTSSLSKKEQEQLVIDAGFGYYKEVETKAIRHKARVNKRKVGTVTVEEG